MNWTQEQKQVIRDRERNVLVAAAAGSGKTAVLTERIISLLREGNSLDDFLIITFTRAAAKDMKDKLRRAIEKTPKLRHQEKQIATAQISTIDSFCHAIVRDHFFYLDIDPAFRVGGENEIAILQDDELRAMFEEYYAAQDEAFLDLVEVFGGDRSDQGLADVILQLERYLNNTIDREAVEQQILAGFSDENYWRQKLERYIAERRQEIEQLLHRASERCFNSKTCELIEADQLVIDQMGTSFARYPTLTKIEKTDPVLVEANIELKTIRDRYRKLACDLANQLAESGDFAELYARYQAQAPRVAKLIELTRQFHQRFFEKRKDLNLLSFADVAALALKAVQNPEIAVVYRERFQFIFIDEYQDTNPIQEGLIECIRRENNVFMVGDIKQSIYRFRQADPTIFLRKFHEYAEPTEQAVRIDLNRNFRSAQPIIDGVNRIFETIMRADYGGIAYDEKSALEFGNLGLSHLDQPIEILLTEAPASERNQAELESIIRRIQQLRAEGYRYRDMVILMRAPSSTADQAIERFKQVGLPLMLDYSSAYLKSLEVEILLNYLRLIDNFRQDIPLLSVLRLPRYGLSDQDLLDIRKQVSDVPFHRAVKSEALPESIQQKLELFWDDMAVLRHHSRSLSIDRLLQSIYYGTDYERFILLMPDGKQRLANVRLLFELAGEYETTSFVGLSKFLRYIERIIEVDQDMEAARIIPEDADSIRLMSIHKSKGLQFPVVFVAGLHRRFNEMDLNRRLLLSDHRAVMDDVDLEQRTKSTSLFKHLLRHDLRSASRQEEIRLLYVAMTRAEQRIILSAALTDIEKDLSDISEHSLGSLMDANNYWRLIRGSGVLASGGTTIPGYRIIRSDELTQMSVAMPCSRVSASGRMIEPVTIPTRETDSKVSVSQLVQREIVHAPLRTSYESEIDGGAERGILFHKAMQWLDFDAIETSLDALVSENILEDFQDRRLVERFLKHEMMQDYLARAIRVHRELPFVYRMEWAGEETLVQGIIDLLIELPEGDVLIDYKTDRSLSYLPRYEAQVKYYAESYENITGRSLARKLIWYVRLERFIEVE